MILLTTVSTTIEKAEVIEFYKTLLVNQSSNYTTLINFFMGITALLVGASIFGNFYLANKKITSEVDEQVKVIKESLDTKYNEILKEEVEKIEKSLEIRHLKNEATLFMSVSMQCINIQDYSRAITFYFHALDKYLKLKKDIVIRQVIEQIYDLLSNDIFISKIIIENKELDDIVVTLNKIPVILSIEKEKILKVLNLLREKNANKSNNNLNI